MNYFSPGPFRSFNRLQRRSAHMVKVIFDKLRFSGSDLLDWLEWLLGGKRQLVPVPIHNDKPRASRPDRK